MRVGVYTDYQYHQAEGRIYAERAFALFMGRVGEHFDELTVIGRLDPSSGSARYPLDPGTLFVALPFYESLSHPLQVCGAAARTLGRFWRALAGIDVLWLLGPHPFAVPFAVMAWARRKRVVLGVRQDSVAYVVARHPRRRALHLLAWLLEAGFRAVAKISPVVAVGPQIAKRYAHAPGVLEISVSLVEDSDLIVPAEAIERDYSGELQLLSVGRLEREKNPLLLAEVLRILVDRDSRWRMVVCGEGPMAAELAERVSGLGLGDRFELRGYVPLHEGLMEIYRGSHVFLHISLTEGLPQVLLEAFAAGLPVVATDVGGISKAVGDAARTIPPDDPDEAAKAVAELVAEEAPRRRLLEQAHEFVSSRTVDAESRRVGEFIIRAGNG